MKKKRLAFAASILFAWFFAVQTNAISTIGPFWTKKECEAAAVKLVNKTPGAVLALPCWDGPPNTIG